MPARTSAPPLVESQTIQISNTNNPPYQKEGMNPFTLI